jgi:hypothetical protein
MINDIFVPELIISLQQNSKIFTINECFYSDKCSNLDAGDGMSITLHWDG